MGYLTAYEFQAAVHVYSNITYQTLGMEYSFFVKHAVEMRRPLIPEELMQEMDGMAAGYTAAGYPTTTDDIIGWNAWQELTAYWWPTVSSKYAKDGPKKAQSMHSSAFVSAGSYSEDDAPVIGHTSFGYFAYGQYFNLRLDLTPSNGHRMVMQSVPGYIGSFTDFWATEAGLAITETTMGGVTGYAPKKPPNTFAPASPASTPIVLTNGLN